MKNWLLAKCPPPLLRGYREAKHRLGARRNRQKSTRDLFSEIYRKKLWGNASGDFSSGLGTSDPVAVSTYIEAISQILREVNLAGTTFVDLGCGDFEIGRRLAALSSRYTGVDIVPELIERNRREYADETIQFQCLDIIEEALPPGEVCFVRQVLQHLSNAQIAAILPKLRTFRSVFITEHHPSAGKTGAPNVDKTQGGGTRLHWNSGVYPDLPPFSIPSEELTVIAEVPGTGFEGGLDQGILRTYHYRPKNSVQPADLETTI